MKKILSFILLFSLAVSLVACGKSEPKEISCEDIIKAYEVIGGAYGFSQAVYDRAGSKMSLSRMTFSHQMVRAIFAEQIYRAFTIMRGEPYHHE